MRPPQLPQLSEVCCCGHDRAEHEYCSDLYPSICMARDEEAAQTADERGGHPLDHVCSCMEFEDEETVF